MPSHVSALLNTKALLFDVFGTVVDWRTSVAEELTLRAFRRLSSPDLSGDLASRLQSLRRSDWGRFVQEWRNSYIDFVRSYNPDTDAWKTIDQHHRESLIELIKKWEMEGLFDDEELDDLSRVWHRLVPWRDSSNGLDLLGQKYITGTLSNGNESLLCDLSRFGSLKFDRFYSGETFRAYKPHPAVYLGAARRLELEPHEVALVAAHLGDLRAAKNCGLRTIYVEREQEEAWGKEEEAYKAARGWVDLWVSKEEQGLLTVAQRLSELE